MFFLYGVAKKFHVDRWNYVCVTLKDFFLKKNNNNLAEQFIVSYQHFSVRELLLTYLFCLILQCCN